MFLEFFEEPEKTETVELQLSQPEILTLICNSNDIKSGLPVRGGIQNPQGMNFATL
jgi:hypothetical protein